MCMEYRKLGCNVTEGCKPTRGPTLFCCKAKKKKVAAQIHTTDISNRSVWERTRDCHGSGTSEIQVFSAMAVVFRVRLILGLCNDAISTSYVM